MRHRCVSACFSCLLFTLPACSELHGKVVKNTEKIDLEAWKKVIHHARFGCLTLKTAGPSHNYSLGFSHLIYAIKHAGKITR